MGEVFNAASSLRYGYRAYGFLIHVEVMRDTVEEMVKVC